MGLSKIRKDGQDNLKNCVRINLAVESFRKIGANVLFQGFGRLITAGASLLVTILVAQSFGPASLGDLTKVLSFVALFYLVADFGFNAIVVKDACTQEEKTTFFLSNLFSLRIFVSFALIILVFLITFALPFNLEKNTGFSPQIKIGIAIASLTILAQAILTSANALFQIRMRYDRSTVALFFGSLVTVFLAFLFINYAFFSWPKALLPIILAYVVGGAISSFLAVSFVKSQLSGFKLKFNFDYWLNLLKRTWPIGLTLVFNLIYFRVDMFILALTRTSTEVGLYSLSYKIFDLSLVFPIFLINASYPTMVESSAKGLKDLLQFSKKIFGVLFVVSSFGLALIFTLAPQVVTLIGGEGFGGSISSLRILVLGLPVFYLTALLMWLLIVFEKQKDLIIIYGSGAVLNVVLNLVFIPQFGYLAAAATTGISELFILLASSIIVFKHLKRT